MGELHEQTLAVMPNHEVSYDDIKPLIDEATSYDVEFNGAHQLLRELEEFGKVGVRHEFVLRHKQIIGIKSYWSRK